MKPSTSHISGHHVSGLQKVVLLWFCWANLLIGFQTLVKARFSIERPDYVLKWTPTETNGFSQNNKPYLLEPFMNSQVSWDSEFYLSIALQGYDDPAVRNIMVASEPISLNYAFFPFYPYLIRTVGFPLKLLKLNPLATCVLAGVLISLFGTLAGMIALYYLVKSELGTGGALRTSFYLVIFPSSFFLAQVYTEGLFIGLAFSCLALLKYKKFAFAALCAALAIWTRPTGTLLLLPFLWTLIKEVDWRALLKPQSHPGLPAPKTINGFLFISLPVAAYLIWNFTLGVPFQCVESKFFNRGTFALVSSLHHWFGAFETFFYNNSQTKVYYLLEFLGVVLGLTACIFTWRRVKAFRGLSLFGFAALVLALTSGPAQGMLRYTLTVPSVFIMLGYLGRHKIFEYVWVLGSCLLLGMLATLFTFDYWLG